jgi:hypothetical protein
MSNDKPTPRLNTAERREMKDAVLNQVLPGVSIDDWEPSGAPDAFMYTENEFQGREWRVWLCETGDHTITLVHGLLEFSCLCNRDWGASARMLEHAISGALHSLSITERLAMIEAHVLGTPVA